ncbi:MAG: sensor histidine kinase N-terminal domain-containing protein [Rhodanobacter sp.]
MTAATAPRRRPSLRRRLLLILLVPMAILLILDALLTYGVALTYANRVHDRDLSDDAVMLAKMLGNQQLGGQLSPQARFLLEYDREGHNYFRVSSRRHGLLAGSVALPMASATPTLDDSPSLYSTRLNGHALRAAEVRTSNPEDAHDSLVVTVAETLHDRRQQASEILLLSILVQTTLIICVLSLVWIGVARGLRVLEPLTARLAARSHELTPIGGPDVPQEILPLTRTIDALFGRLRSMMALHDRFIADAAHQLRTPLTGLSLHVDRALADPRPETVADALVHIQRLTRRAARTSSQLLALTRAQASPLELDEPQRLDLGKLIRDAVTQRVPDALRADVDLGYEGTGGALAMLGDASSVLDLLDNLIDNAVRYAGNGGMVTVDLRRRADGDICLSVEDSGPGVAPDLLPRLSERFFRAAAGSDEGSGLGLAIVQRIAERHGASVTYGLVDPHGLRVEVLFPPPSTT